MFARLPWTAPLLASFCFAVMAISVKMLTSRDHLDHSQVMFFRALLPTLLVLPIALRERPATPPDRGAYLGMLARGLSGAVSMWLYFFALALAPTAIAVLTSNTAPVWTAIFATFLLKEPPPPNLAWALPLALIGSTLVCTAHGITLSSWQGAALGLTSALFSGMAYTCVRQLRALPASWVTMSLTLTATLAALPAFHAAPIPPHALPWIALMGLSGGFAQLFMTIGYHHNGAAQASTLGLCAVLFSTLLGRLILQEPVNLQQALGIAAVLIGVAAVIPRVKLSAAAAPTS